MGKARAREERQQEREGPWTTPSRDAASRSARDLLTLSSRVRDMRMIDSEHRRDYYINAVYTPRMTG